MKRHQSKFTPKEQSQIEQETASTQAHQEANHEFTSADLLLRHDALHTPVPPAIAHRLQCSIAQLPPRRKSLWRRMFGK